MRCNIVPKIIRLNDDDDDDNNNNNNNNIIIIDDDDNNNNSRKTLEDIPSTCSCGEALTVDHSMICRLGGFINQRHNELRDLEAEFLSMVCSDVEIEQVLQDISVEELKRGSNKAQDARLDIQARGFWERH